MNNEERTLLLLYALCMAVMVFLAILFGLEVVDAIIEEMRKSE